MNKQLLFSLAIGTLFLTACQNDPAGDAYKSTDSSLPTTTNTTEKPMQTQSPQPGDTIATIETDKGTIKFKLFTAEAPETTKNFIELAKAGQYDGVPFHRVIPDFMIQTGDFTNKNGTGGYSYKGPGTTFEDEFAPGLLNLKGTVSMANSGANTNGSQFFIITAAQGTPWLNGKHSVFGQVFEGQDVVDAISKVQTFRDAPLTAVLMNKITISSF